MRPMNKQGISAVCKILRLPGVLVCLYISALGGCASTVSDGITQTPAQMLEQEWGVRVIGIRTTAAGYMLDFRYRILDADKATPILNRKTKPELIVEHNGTKLYVPVTSKIGPLRQSAKFVKEDKNYYMFFANPGRYVQPGDKVTVVIGDFKAEHITVN